MNKNKFTPGPWTAKMYSNTNKCFVVANETIIFEETTIDSRNVSPNAAIIAAAPEMFEALETVLGFFNFKNTEEKEFQNEIKSILKKAKGE